MRSDRLGEALVAVALVLAFGTDLRVLVPITAIALVAGAAIGHLRSQAAVGAAVLGAATWLLATGSEVGGWALVLAVVVAAALGATTGAPALAGTRR